MINPPREIYFLRPVGMQGPVKIGCSAIPERRLRELMVWSPLRLEIVARLPGDLNLERRLHEAFAGSRSHLEWFQPTDQLTRLIDGLNAGIALGELVDLTKPLSVRRSARRPISADRRQYLSYVHRVRWALLRANAQASERVLAPDHVDRLINNWGHRDERPTAEGLKILQDFIAEPAAYCISYREKYPRETKAQTLEIVRPAA